MPQGNVRSLTTTWVAASASSCDFQPSSSCNRTSAIAISNYVTSARQGRKRTQPEQGRGENAAGAHAPGRVLVVPERSAVFLCHRPPGRARLCTTVLFFLNLRRRAHKVLPIEAFCCAGAVVITSQCIGSCCERCRKHRPCASGAVVQTWMGLLLGGESSSRFRTKFRSP